MIGPDHGGRFTEIDRVIGNCVAGDGTVTVAKLFAVPGPEARMCTSRMQVLEFRIGFTEAGWDLEAC
jgi:hypothetical protein